MAFYFDTMKNIDLSHVDYNPETNEVNLKDFKALCDWGDGQNYTSSQQEMTSYVRITRTDKKGVIIHQEMIQFPFPSGEVVDSILINFNKKSSSDGAAKTYTIPLDGEVELPKKETESEEAPQLPKEEVKEDEIMEVETEVEEVEVNVPQEKTETTKKIERLQEEKEQESKRELSEEERHDRVTNLAEGFETDDYRSEVDESDLPPVIKKESRKEYEERTRREEKKSLNENEKRAEEFAEFSSNIEISEKVNEGSPLDLDESVVLFKQHLQEIVKNYEDERNKATATANDLISSFVAIGNGLMEGQVTYEKVGQEMMDKGQEISRIGSHINFQEKKIANIMNLNKEIDKVLQDEEEE